MPLIYEHENLRNKYKYLIIIYCFNSKRHVLKYFSFCTNSKVLKIIDCTYNFIIKNICISSANCLLKMMLLIILFLLSKTQPRNVKNFWTRINALEPQCINAETWSYSFIYVLDMFTVLLLIAFLMNNCLHRSLKLNKWLQVEIVYKGFRIALHCHSVHVRLWEASCEQLLSE